MQKFVIISLLVALFASCGSSTQNQTSEGQLANTLEDARVMVYYFHGKQRCVTCVTLQEVSQATIAEHFAENEDVRFVEIDFSQKKNEQLAEKYQIVFSSLVIASGDDYLDMTDEAFALVMRSPDVLKQKIADQVNTYLAL